jgi:hypothetical protein
MPVERQKNNSNMRCKQPFWLKVFAQSSRSHCPAEPNIIPHRDLCATRLQISPIFG